MMETQGRMMAIQGELTISSMLDSRALLTLSVITIIFLPGTFLATLFTTNMFTFGEGQEVRIYRAIVSPTTVLLVIGWILLQIKLARSTRKGLQDAENPKENAPAIQLSY